MSNSFGSFLLGGLVQPLLGTLQNWTKKREEDKENTPVGGDKSSLSASSVTSSQQFGPILLRQGGRIIPADPAPPAGVGRGRARTPSHEICSARKRRKGGRKTHSCKKGHKLHRTTTGIPEESLEEIDSCVQNVSEGCLLVEKQLACGTGKVMRTPSQEEGGCLTKIIERTQVHTQPTGEEGKQEEFSRGASLPALPYIKQTQDPLQSSGESTETVTPELEIPPSSAFIHSASSSSSRSLPRPGEDVSIVSFAGGTEKQNSFKFIAGTSFAAQGRLNSLQSTQMDHSIPSNFPSLLSGSSSSCSSLVASSSLLVSSSFGGNNRVENTADARVLRHPPPIQSKTCPSSGAVSPFGPASLYSSSASAVEGRSEPGVTHDGHPGKIAEEDEEDDDCTGLQIPRFVRPVTALSSVSSTTAGTSSYRSFSSSRDADRSGSSSASSLVACQSGAGVCTSGTMAHGVNANVHKEGCVTTVDSSDSQTPNAFYSKDEPSEMNWPRLERSNQFPGVATHAGRSAGTVGQCQAPQRSEQSARSVFSRRMHRSQDDDDDGGEEEQQNIPDEGVESRGDEWVDRENDENQEEKGPTEVFGHRVLRPLRSKDLQQNYDALIDIVRYAKKRCEKESTELLRKDIPILYYARGLHHPSHVETFGKHPPPQRSRPYPASIPSSSSSLPSVSAALAAGARPSKCPAWATPENLAKAVHGQEKFNPFTVFGEAPPEVVLSDIYDERHYTYVSVNTRASHPAIFRLLSGRRHQGLRGLDNAMEQRGAARHPLDEEERRIRIRQTQEKLRDQVASGEISAEEAQRRWVRELQESLNKEEQDTRKQLKAFQDELIQHGFSGKLDARAFREKLLPALEAWWRGQCEIELDWRHDPLTSEECTWYIEAMGAVVDATDVISFKQACFCPTPPPYQPWAWTDSRFRLRQKAEQERAARLKTANEKKEKMGMRCNRQRVRGGRGRRGGRIGPKDVEHSIQDAEDKLHQPHSGEVEDDSQRGKGKRLRCSTRQDRGTDEYSRDGNGCVSWYSADASQAKARDKGDKAPGSTPSEGSPITPQVRLGVRGSVLVTRRGQIIQEEAGSGGEADTRSSKRQKGEKADLSRQNLRTFETEKPTTAADTISAWSSSDGHYNVSVLQDTVVHNSAETQSATTAATHTLVASSSSRAYHWNTPTKGIRSTLERRAIAEGVLTGKVVGQPPGGSLRKVSEHKDMPTQHDSAVAGSSWGDHLGSRVLQTGLQSGGIERVNNQLSPYCGVLTSALQSPDSAQGGALTRGLRGQNSIAAPLTASSTTLDRSSHVSPECIPKAASSGGIDLTARDGWRRNPFSRPLALMPRARLSIDRVYGARHNDVGRAVYQGWSLFQQTHQVACSGVSGIGPMRRRSKGRGIVEEMK
ncbi:inner centromere ark-binding region protein [Cystoisospora suis]|uniref:Inner centromere ark-binding region protein n=1 Tax=Cystoisospora suis TaxID=483139 RepID=A0A2C6KXI5_9APIC|nr:inner centromere ark-binding region protein [Cystoisospora suis]